MPVKSGTRLSDMDLDEISFVTRGANQHAKILLFKSEESPDYSHEYIVKRNFTAERRKELAGKGKAMPGGKFPIESEEDLKNAVKLAGKAKDPAAAKAHIKRRAKAMGKEKLLPDSWVSKNANCGYDHRSLKKNERCPSCGMRSTGRQGKMRKSDGLSGLLERALGSDDELLNYYLEKAEEEAVPKLIDGLDLDGLDEDVQAAIKELNDDNVALAKGIKKANEEKDEAVEALEEANSGNEDEDDDESEDEDSSEDNEEEDSKSVTKGDNGEVDISKLDPDTRSLIEKSQREAAQAKRDAKEASEIAKAERDQRLNNEFIAKADKEWSHISKGLESDEVTAIREMADAHPEAWTKVDQMLKSANEVAKTSELFTELGSSDVDATSSDAAGIVAKVEAEAKKLISKGDGKLTKEAAIAQIITKDHPEWYAEYRDAKKDASK